MQTITTVTNVYSFSELSNDAKETALNNYRNSNNGDSEIYSGEIIDSVKALIELFNLKIGRTYSDLRYSHLEDNILQLSGARLYKWLINNYSKNWIDRNYISKHKDGSFKNSYFQYKYDCVKYRKSRISVTNNLENCPLTGVCYDMDIMQPVIDFLKKPDNSTFEDLINGIESAISKTFNNVDKWINSDEFIKDELEANDYQFTEDGKIF